jgi:hypothetical protein
MLREATEVCLCEPHFGGVGVGGSSSLNPSYAILARISVES